MKHFSFISAALYFSAGVWLISSPSVGLEDANKIMRFMSMLICASCGVLILAGNKYPLRLMSAGLFLVVIFGLFKFSGFDESGATFHEKIWSSVFDLLIALFIFISTENQLLLREMYCGSVGCRTLATPQRAG